MYDRLPYKDFVPYAPEDTEESLCVAHQDCDNGIDHKQRLWIKRNEDGSINALCHNCQRKGYYKDKEYHRSLSTLLAKKNNTEGSVTEVQLPDDVTRELDKFPPKALVWLYKARLTNEEIEQYDICYSPYYNRVILPVYDEKGDIIFWQGRSIDLQKDPLKYFSSRAKKDEVLFYATERTGDTVVIVEDVLSAIRVGRSMPSVCSMGVSMSQQQLMHIASNFNNAVIFLDDDNPTVRKRQLLIKRDLLSLMNSVKIHHSEGIDPKEYNDEDLKEILDGY